MAIDLERSGWENLDGHKTTKDRPMFGPDGVTPITAPPEPDDLTPAERAMFAAMGPSTVPADPVPQKVLAGLTHLPSGTPAAGRPADERLDIIARLAAEALDSDKPGQWALALGKIQDVAS